MKFSIITPVYNAKKYIGRTIRSVLAQSYQDWELICVDDGSSDDSGRILDDFTRKDSRIRVVHQENGGEGAARNTALKRATGDWIIFLDADDLLSPWALAEYARVSSQHPEASMTRLEILQFCGDSDPDWSKFASNVDQVVRAIDVGDSISLEMWVSHFFQFAYSRSLIDGLEYTNHYVGADRVFLLKCLARADWIACASQVAYAYRQIPTSITGSAMTLRKLRDRQLYRLECIECLSRSGKKKFAPAAMREFGNVLMECSVYDISRLPLEDRKAGWRLWLGWLPWLRTLNDFSYWRRFTIWACILFAWVPFRMVPRLLCEVPWRLKVSGVHR